MLLVIGANLSHVKRSPPADREQSSFPTPPTHAFPQQRCSPSVVSGLKKTHAAKEPTSTAHVASVVFERERSFSSAQKAGVSRFPTSSSPFQPLTLLCQSTSLTKGHALLHSRMGYVPIT